MASPNDETACETLDDIEAASRTAGFEAPSEHQLERWRGEGLLPHACQIPQAYRGSIVRHPVGTAKQAVEIVKLLKIKKKFYWVGRELWWNGYSVDEKYWKADFTDILRIRDRIMFILKSVKRREDNITSGKREMPASMPWENWKKPAQKAIKNQYPFSLVGIVTNPTYLRFCFELYFKEISTSEELASEDQEEILRNFGIKHYGTRQIEPVHLNVMGNNWSAPDWTSVFHQTIQIFTEMSPKDIQDLDIEELNLIREKTKSVFDSVQIISRHFSAIGFKNAFGFRLISLISSIGGSFRGGFVFLIYLWSKQDNNRADFLEYERIIAPFADLLRHLHVDSRNQTVRNIDTGASIPIKLLKENLQRYLK